MFFPWSFRFLRFLPFKVWLWNFWNYKEKVLGGTKNSKFWKYHFLFIGLWTLVFFYWKEYWMNEWMSRILENPDITVFIVLLMKYFFPIQSCALFMNCSNMYTQAFFVHKYCHISLTWKGGIADRTHKGFCLSIFGRSILFMNWYNMAL